MVPTQDVIALAARPELFAPFPGLVVAAVVVASAIALAAAAVPRRDADREPPR